MEKYQVIYYDYADEPVPYKGKIFDSKQDAEEFIETNYSDDLGSDIRINSNGDDEWFTKTGVWNPEENEWLPSAYAEPYIEEMNESFKRMQELAGIKEIEDFSNVSKSEPNAEVVYYEKVYSDLFLKIEKIDNLYYCFEMGDDTEWIKDIKPFNYLDDAIYYIKSWN